MTSELLYQIEAKSLNTKPRYSTKINKVLKIYTSHSSTSQNYLIHITPQLLTTYASVQRNKNKTKQKSRYQPMMDCQDNEKKIRQGTSVGSWGILATQPIKVGSHECNVQKEDSEHNKLWPIKSGGLRMFINGTEREKRERTGTGINVEKSVRLIQVCHSAVEK